MSDTTFTHKDLARMLGVSETTVKSYRRKFPGCIPVANQGKPIRFTAQAAQVATRIRTLFDTGMSVEEVRSRLAAEFAFIPAEAEKPAPEKPAGRQGERQEISPELSLGVSNMAKSMVALTQQQKAILARVQGIEAMLEELGLEGGEDANAVRGQRTEAARQRERQMESRLDRLDESAKELAQIVSSLAEQLGRLVGQRNKAADEWRTSGAETLSTASRLAAEAMAGEVATAEAMAAKTMAAETLAATAAAAQSVERQPSEPVGARVVSFRPDASPDRALFSAQQGIQQGGQRVAYAPVQNDAQVAALPAEPPRQFFALPLVARTEQGQYVSAGGKSRGRFSLNDLKAMLIYGYTPPDHFILRWERHGQGWWLFLEQETSDRAIHLLLMELPSQRGGNVAEILKIRHNGETLHPAEICGIIDAFSSREL